MLEALLELKGQARDDRINQAWQNLIQSEDGQIAVGSLLDELGYLDPISGPDGIARHNIAVVILARIKKNATRKILEALIERRG